MAPGLASADRDDRWDNDDRWDRKDRWEQRVGGDRWRRDHWRDRNHWRNFRALPRHHWQRSWYAAPRHPWYPRYPYRDHWRRGPGVIGGVIIGSALGGALVADDNCRDCVRYRDARPPTTVTGCYRIERSAEGYERRVELPTSECLR